MALGLYLSSERAATGARRLPQAVEPGEKLRHRGFLWRRHEVEVAPAVDDLPVVLGLHPLELQANGPQPLGGLCGHVHVDAPRFVFGPRHEVIRRELHLRLANPLERELVARARTIELEERAKEEV